MTDDFEQDREGTPAEHERNRLLVAPLRELVDRIMAQEAEVERLQVAARAAYDAFALPEGYTNQERYAAMRTLGVALGLLAVTPEASDG